MLIGSARQSERVVSWLRGTDVASGGRVLGGIPGLALFLGEPGTGADLSSQTRRTNLWYLSGGGERIVGVLEEPSASSGAGPGPAANMDTAGRGGASAATVPTVFVRGLETNRAVDDIVVVKQDASIDALLDACLSFAKSGSSVLAASPVFEILRRGNRVEEFDRLPVASFRPKKLEGWRLGVKRATDLLGAVFGGIVLLPLFLLVALLVRLTSAGPVLYRQARIGKDGRQFTFYKFRTMTGGDDSAHKEYLKSFVKDGRPAGTDGRGRNVYKIVNDPRITAVGRFLRKTSLDEFPQLINVLRGEMSLVGPRPCLPYEWVLYEDWQKARLSATPGLTGLWQVTGRSNVTFHDMVILDLFYLHNWSFWWDLKLILQTIPVILLGKGGH